MKTPERIIREHAPTEGIDDVIATFRYPAARQKPAPQWPAAAGLTVALAVGVIAFRLSIPSAEASPMAQIAEAEKIAPRCIVQYFDGTGRLWGHGWQAGKQVRLDMDPTEPYGWLRANDGKRVWTIDRGAGTATISTEDAMVIAPLIRKVSDFKGEQVSFKHRTDGMSELVLEVKAAGTSPAQRIAIVADAQNRPVRVDNTILRNGTWELHGREVREYETPIAPETFKFQPPKGFEVYDIDANLDRLRAGLRHGLIRSAGGVPIRLIGAIQSRNGMVTALYTGGENPLPDAVAEAQRDGHRVRGFAAVGIAPDPRVEKPLGYGTFRWPGVLKQLPKDAVIDVGPKPYLQLDGVDLRIVRFRLPKLPGNRPQPIHLTLPAVAKGAERTLKGVRGVGQPKGTVAFDITPIASNGGEEVYRQPSVKRSAYEIALARP